MQDPQHTQLFLILSHKLVDRLKCHLSPFEVMIEGIIGGSWHDKKSLDDTVVKQPFLFRSTRQIVRHSGYKMVCISIAYVLVTHPSVVACQNLSGTIKVAIIEN